MEDVKQAPAGAGAEKDAKPKGKAERGEKYSPLAGEQKSNYRGYANQVKGPGGAATVEAGAPIPEPSFEPTPFSPEAARPLAESGGAKSLGINRPKKGMGSVVNDGKDGSRVTKSDSKALASMIADVYEMLVETIGPQVCSISVEQLSKSLKKEGVDVSILGHEVPYKGATKTVAELIDMANEQIKAQLTVDPKWKEDWVEDATEVFYEQNVGLNKGWGLVIKTGTDLLRKAIGVYMTRKETIGYLKDVANSLKADSDKMARAQERFAALQAKADERESSLAEREKKLAEAERKANETGGVTVKVEPTPGAKKPRSRAKGASVARKVDDKNTSDAVVVSEN